MAFVFHKGGGGRLEGCSQIHPMIPGGPVQQPMPPVDNIPQSGTKNLATNFRSEYAKMYFVSVHIYCSKENKVCILPYIAYDVPNAPSAGLIRLWGGGGSEGFSAVSANFPKTGMWMGEGGKGEGSIGADGERFMPKSIEGAYK
jgi:hypothetical protein